MELKEGIVGIVPAIDAAVASIILAAAVAMIIAVVATRALAVEVDAGQEAIQIGGRARPNQEVGGALGGCGAAAGPALHDR